MTELHIVGQPLPRPDALDKTMGRTKYVNDLFLPRMAFAGIYYSPYAHAKIEWLDKKKAQSVPGVITILTAQDIPGKNFIPLIKDDWIFLAKDKVVYAGEPVAVIVAENTDAVYRARDLLEASYEELPAVFDPEESLKPGAPQINPLGNLLSYHKIRSGDIEKGFAEADVIVEGVYETGYQEHAYLETQGFLAEFCGDEGIRILGSMQCPFYVQNAVSSILGIPQNKVQVIQSPTGGAFGGKEDFPSLFGGLSALAAYKTGRPVKLVLDRRDDIILSSKRHPSKSYYRTGAKKDGSLTACEIRVYLDPGAYATLTPSVLWRCAVHCYGPYRIPHLKVDAYAGATNKAPCGAFRGFGTPQIIFAMERQMDKLASALGMDPFALREKNCWRTGDTTGTGQVLPWSVGLFETIARAQEMSGWKEKRPQYPLTVGTKKTGIGCSTFLYGVGLGAAGRKIDKAEAYVQVKPDGSVFFAVGTTDMGQGMQTVLTQIVAEGLGGIPATKVQMLPVDTTRVEDSGPTVASRATFISGNALLDACSKIVRKMKNAASELLLCPASSLKLDKGFFVINHDSLRTKEDITREMPFEKAAEECFQRHISLCEHGFFDSPPSSWDPETGQGKAYVTYSYATQIAEVEVDMETGEVEVKHVWAAHDVGKAINPQQTSAQIEGGVIQGLGYALMEALVVDSRGRIQNPSFATYIIPTTMDIPEIETAIIESPYPEGPYGAKGFGETPLMGMAGCIANAVAQATGLDITRIPILPESLLES